MNRDKLKNFSPVFTADHTNYMQAFRKNIDLYIKEKVLTVREISEISDIPYSTLSAFLYGDSSDCKLSTAVKLARSLGVSIDELVGAETINPITRESLSICRRLPEHSLYLVRYFIRHQRSIYEKRENPEETISVLEPPFVGGRLLMTNVTYPIDISHLPPMIKTAVFIGLKIPCEYYEPFYFPDETILIAADREGTEGERCVVTHDGRIFIVLKRSYIENGVKKWKYVALKNNKIEMPEASIDDKVGYIVGFLNPDGSWGRR